MGREARDAKPEKLQDWLGEIEGSGGAISIGPFAEAAAHGDVAVLAVLDEAVGNVLELAGAENLSGTLVLDATNPLDFSRGMPPGLLFGGRTRSASGSRRRYPRRRS